MNQFPFFHFPCYLVLNPPRALKEGFESRVLPPWSKIHSKTGPSGVPAMMRDDDAEQEMSISSL